MLRLVWFLMTATVQPEVNELIRGANLIRIPDQMDVPITPRVRHLIDTACFRRLASVRQLGFVSLVYPGAVHNRFEHSLGVYRSTLLFLRQLMLESRFQDAMDSATLDGIVVASLLHDIAHYPFCHPIEDLGLESIDEHETLAATYLESEPVSSLLRNEWECDSAVVQRLLKKTPTNQAEQIGASLLSGPIDPDKLDYLFRDSLHSGVPYGRNFDAPRLISSLCLNRDATGLAITTKGRTAAELMVFARYVMFSEVYWHHTVRSATAMFQRLFFSLHSDLNMARIYSSTESSFASELQRVSVSEPGWLELYISLFGNERKLYKQWGQFSCHSDSDVFSRLARRPFAWLANCSKILANSLAEQLGETVMECEVLIDAPPVGLEVQFEIDVFDSKREQFMSLGTLSPVVRALAERQFDDFVKQVRIFVHPRIMEKIKAKKLVLAPLLNAAATQLDG
ncbi:MAG: HD domain-containing protein [Pirellulaceae bacterium]